MKLNSRKVALITGGSRGIGREIAKIMAKENYNVAINYRTMTDKLINLKKEINEEYSGDSILVQGDIRNYEESKKIVEETVRKLGGIDVLVNNAGITRDELLMGMSKEDFEIVINTNLIGTFYITQNTIPYMIKKNFGRIINISSIAGIVGNIGQTNYSASKAAVIGFTKSLAKELASNNILVNAVAPGFIETDMTKIVLDKQREKIFNQIPLKRIGKTTDVANLVKFLASKEASYITGQVINVDGGLVT